MMLSFNEDCLHIVEHRAFDKFGNHEEWQKQHVKVDCTPPNITKVVEEPNCYQDLDADNHDVWCVDLSTNITFSAEDFGCYWELPPPHPGIGLETFEYRVWNQSHGWTEWMTANPAGETYQFAEECKHYLEIKAVDKFGNTVVDNETFYVDDTYPVIVKTVGDPNCYISEDEYCVTTDTIITIDASDNGCCDDLTVKYQINGSIWKTIQSLPYNFSFESECNHTLNITAYDCLGHQVFDNETFHVDDSPPVIIKKVGDPSCETILEAAPGIILSDDDDDDFQIIGVPYCVTTSTEINITAIDDDCCPYSDITIEYRIWSSTHGWGDGWMLYEGNFSFGEECKHYLEIRAYDCLENGIDIVENETFYVDDTYPVIVKTVGDPNCYISEDEYCVTTDTNITIDAYDLIYN